VVLVFVIMQSLEEAFEGACSDGIIPGAVIAAVNKTGTFKYEKSFGVRSVQEGKDARLETDTLMTLASCSKLITTIAVLQLVERGQIGLDDDTAHVLPELAKQKIINGMKDGKPDLLERKNPITLRYIITTSLSCKRPLCLDYRISNKFSDTSQPSPNALFRPSLSLRVPTPDRISSINNHTWFTTITQNSGWNLQLAWPF
jgi:hypothetical protein